MSLSPTKFALGPLVRPVRDGLIYAPLRLWYLGSKQQMASPLAPWNLPPWTSLSFSPCLLPPVCLSWPLPLSQRWLAVPVGALHSRIAKAPSHHLSIYTRPSSKRRPAQRLFALALTEKLEDRRPKKKKCWFRSNYILSSPLSRLPKISLGWHELPVTCSLHIHVFH